METPTIHPPERTLPSAAQQPHATRRVELDWLRMLIVLATIPFHAVPIIGASRRVLMVSAESNPILMVLGGFVLTWGIPLIFLLSGAAAKLALDVRSPGAYERERLLRLGGPLLLMLVFIAPVQIYFILLSNPNLIQMGPRYGITFTPPSSEQLGGFGSFYPQYLGFLVTSVRGFTPLINSLILGHLWFVPRLLVVSFISLPLLLYLRGRGHGVTERLTAMAAARPAVLLLLGGLVPAALVALLQPGWLNRLTAGWIFTDDWPAFSLNLVMFVYGALIYSSERLRAAIRTQAFLALALGVGCAGVVVTLIVVGRAPASDYSLASLLFVLAETLMAWLPVLGLLGLAMRYLTVSTPMQRYLSDAAFPVFVLHGPLLAASAYYVLQMPLPAIVQLVLVLILTVAGSFGIYEYIVRRTPVTRLLFGVKAPQAAKPALRG